MSVILAYTSTPLFPLILTLPTCTNPSNIQPTLLPPNSTLHSLPYCCYYRILLYTSLFDYFNNLLFNLPAYKLIKLQRLQNAVVLCIHNFPVVPLIPLHLSSNNYTGSQSPTVLNTNFP